MESEVNPGGYIDNHGQPVKESFWAKFKRPIAGLAAGVTIVTGAGAMAEKTTPTVDNPTKIEGEVDSSEASVKDEMPQLPEDNSSESTTNTTEGQITAKGGVGDLLGSANGTVTSGDVGVEVPKSDGGEVKYASNVTNENGQPVIVPLEGSGSGEVEKKQEQMIIENMVSFLRNESPNADENIKDSLLTFYQEETEDIGLINERNVQGRLLGCSRTIDGRNLVLVLGVKDTKKVRFITLVRVPIYDVENPNTYGFPVSVLDDLSYIGGSASSMDVKSGEFIEGVLRGNFNRNIIVNLYTDKVTNDDIKRAKKVGNVEYVDEMKKNVSFSKSLAAKVYRNNISLEFNNPKSKLVMYKNIPDIDDTLVKSFPSIDVSNIPIILGLTYSRQN